MPGVVGALLQKTTIPEMHVGRYILGNVVLVDPSFPRPPPPHRFQGKKGMLGIVVLNKKLRWGGARNVTVFRCSLSALFKIP